MKLVRMRLVHGMEELKKVYVNPAHVVTIEPETKGMTSVITFTNRGSMHVEDSPRVAAELLADLVVASREP